MTPPELEGRQGVTTTRGISHQKRSCRPLEVILVALRQCYRRPSEKPSGTTGRYPSCSTDEESIFLIARPVLPPFTSYGVHYRPRLRQYHVAEVPYPVQFPQRCPINNFAARKRLIDAINQHN